MHHQKISQTKNKTTMKATTAKVINATQHFISGIKQAMIDNNLSELDVPMGNKHITLLIVDNKLYHKAMLGDYPLTIYSFHSSDIINLTKAAMKAIVDKFSYEMTQEEYDDAFRDEQYI